MLEAAEWLSKTDIDQSAQTMFSDYIDVAGEVRFEELEHAAKLHSPFRRSL